MSEKQYKQNLHEITVTAKKPKHKAPNIFKEDWDSLFGKKRVSGVNRAWKRNPKYMQGLQDVNNTIGAVASLPIVGC